MALIEFTINMNCGVGRDEDADVFVSHCPTLDIFSQGETEEEALEAIKSAVTLHLTTAYDFNRLDKVLRKAGFEAFSGNDENGSRPSLSPAKQDEEEFVAVKTIRHTKFRQIPITLRSSSLQSPYACVSEV